MEPQVKPRFTVLKVLIVTSAIWSTLAAFAIIVTDVIPRYAHYYLDYFVLRLVVGFLQLFSAPLDVIIGGSFFISNWVLSFILVPIDPSGPVFKSTSFVKLFLIQPLALIMFSAATWGAYKIGISKRNYGALALIGAGLFLYAWYLVKAIEVVYKEIGRGKEFPSLLIALDIVVLIVHCMLWVMAFRWYRRGSTQNEIK